MYEGKKTKQSKYYFFFIDIHCHEETCNNNKNKKQSIFFDFRIEFFFAMIWNVMILVHYAAW